ncbi:MAG TPA: type II CAAX endopeptidase family protein [Anaerolineae bacterium]|nr:type II CAAX endopeptidase family protein [Anaerolineae bacterium]
MENSKSSQASSLIWYFVLTFGFSWLFWLSPVLSSQGFFTLPIPNMVCVIIGAHGPLFAAVVLTFKLAGWGAVKQLIRSGFNLRMTLGWWLAIISIPFILTGIAVWVNVVLNDYQPDTTMLTQPLMIVPTFLIMFFLGGSFQEEFGWRGYALPRLLTLSSPLMASLLLGTIWGVWHLPLFYISGVSQSFMPFGIFLPLTIVFSIMFTWFFQKTKHNLFSALLFHTAINTALSLFPPIEQKIGGNQMALTYLMIAYLCLSLLLIAKEFTFWRTKLVSN